MNKASVFVFLLVCATAQAFQAPYVSEANQPNPNAVQPAHHQVGFHAQLQFQNLPPNVNNWVQRVGGLRQLPQQQVHTGPHIMVHDLRHFMMVYRTTANFYDECGASVRHCGWRPKPRPIKSKVMSKLSKAYDNDMEKEEAQSEKLEMERICTVVKTVCVGNTEHCVTNKDCDMALRITERSFEGENMEKGTKIIAVSALDMCDWDDLSVNDNSKMNQRYSGIGFAAYDPDQQLHCRALKAADFKLIFLQKNVPEAGEDSQRVCKHKARNDTSTVKNIYHFIAREIETWPTLCESLQGHSEEGVYNLKSFLKNHVSTSRYTSFFSPPFDFADNFGYQTSANGMLVSGSVTSEEE